MLLRREQRAPPYELTVFSAVPALLLHNATAAHRVTQMPGGAGMRARVGLHGKEYYKLFHKGGLRCQTRVVTRALHGASAHYWFLRICNYELMYCGTLFS